MAKKVTVDNLGTEIEKILAEYQGEVQDHLDVVTKKIGQKGAQALRNQSKSTFPVKAGGKTSGTYEKGWTSMASKPNRLYTVVTIYNKKRAGLAHLLEFGHVSANGTGRYERVPEHPHVAPVEQALVVEYEREVKANL